VGTACAIFAETLATAGHDVTLLYAGPFETGDAAHWCAHYARQGVRFEVPASPPVPLEGTMHARTSYVVYEWIKAQASFDVIQFPDINGLGFYSIQAKRLGIAFQQTYLYVVLHSPTLWHLFENRELVEREEHLALEFMERESIAHADALVAPTNYLLSWAKDWGFRLPRDVYVQPYVSPTGSYRMTSGSDRAAGDERRVSELVFFGRLESRKGLELFCDALDVLAGRGALKGATVTFLGKNGRVRHEDGVRFVGRRTAHLGVPVRLESTMGQAEALDYLRGRPALAIMPSLADNMPFTVLECLAERLPFVATLAGGIPEMIAAEDRHLALAAPEPSALADLIERALREGAPLCRSAIDREAVRRQWVAWHELLAARTAPPAPASAHPLVSVCIATRNRPDALLEALESVRAQTYSPLEVVLVDDASDRQEALRTLDALEPEFVGRGWQIVRRATQGHPSAARNTAARHARGEYLLFMDDDNLARPHEVETFVGASLHSGVPILTCIFDHFRAAPRRANEREEWTDPRPMLRWLPLGPALALGLLWNPFGDTNMIVRRDTFLSLGGFDEDREALVEDWIFLSRAALARVDMAVVPEPLFWYRVWDDTHSPRQSTLIGRRRQLGAYLEGESPDRRALILYAVGLHEQVSAVELLKQADEARSKTLAARFGNAGRLIAIGAGDGQTLKAVRDVEISEAGDGILLRSLGSDPSAWLPVHPPPFVHSIVRIELSASRPTSLQLFWSTEAVPHPCEEQSTTVGFPKGRHIGWAEIPAAAHAGRIRLDPSYTTGDYILHSLEIRCESNSTSRSPRGLAKLVPRLLMPSPELPMAERFSRARMVLNDMASDPGNFTPLRAVEIARSHTGIVLRSLDRDPQVHLAALDARGRPMIARLEATSSIETTAQLFWATRRRTYCEEQSALVSLARGHNVGYIAIPRGAVGRFRFDPATAAGEITLHSLEIRAEG